MAKEVKADEKQAVPQLTTEEKLAIRDIQHQLSLGEKVLNSLVAQLLQKYGVETFMVIDDRSLQFIPKG